MADKDFKVKQGLDLGTPLSLAEGGTGQTTASNALNALLPVQSSQSGKILETDGTNVSWITKPVAYQRGNTASRPASPSIGDLYYDTTVDGLIQYKSTGWSVIAPVPNAPTSVSATASGNNILVSFTAPTNVTVSSYTATSSPESITASASSSPITVTGVNPSTTYTFTVTATGANGISPSSSASNSIVLQILAGYLYGGNGGTTTINKLQFSNDTYTTLAATPPVGITQGAGSANSGVAGYSYGGYETTYTNRIAKLNFTSDAVSSLGATITTASYGTASFSDSGTAGYKTGGHEGSTFLAAVDKLTYSNETKSNTGANMGSLYLLSGISNKGAAGYTVGGYSWSTNFVSTVYKFVFSTNSVSTPTSYGLAQYTVTNWENNGTAGYSIGGGEDFPSTLYKMPFSTDAMSATSSSLLGGGSDWGGGLAQKGAAGYYALGRSNKTATQKFMFSNDARSSLAQTLTNRYGIISMSNTGVI